MAPALRVANLHSVRYFLNVVSDSERTPFCVWCRPPAYALPPRHSEALNGTNWPVTNKTSQSLSLPCPNIGRRTRPSPSIWPPNDDGDFHCNLFSRMGQSWFSVLFFFGYNIHGFCFYDNNTGVSLHSKAWCSP